MDGAAHAALENFFDRAQRLERGEVAALLDSARRAMPPTHVELTLHPDFLKAVRQGTWTSDHQQCVTTARQLAKTTARQLAPWRQRRALARALADAAIAAICRAEDVSPLSADLVQELDEAWREAFSTPRLA